MQQATILTTAHGLATRLAIELIEGLRYKLQMFRVTLDGPYEIFCDKLFVVDNGSKPESFLKRKQNTICYHTIREAVTAGLY